MLPEIPNSNDPPEPNDPPTDNPSTSRNNITPPPSTPGPSRVTTAFEDPITDSVENIQTSVLSEIPSEPSIRDLSLQRSQRVQDSSGIRAEFEALQDDIESQRPANFFTHPSDPIEAGIDPEVLQSIIDAGFDDELEAQLAFANNSADKNRAVSDLNSERGEIGGISDSGEDEEEFDDMECFITHKMVFVANMSLKMGVGKLAAQVGHATLGLYRKIGQTQEGLDTLRIWRRHGEMKVVVKGTDEEHLLALLKKAKENNLVSYMVHDAGRTQIAAGSRTILGIFGTLEKVDMVTGDLKLL